MEYDNKMGQQKKQIACGAHVARLNGDIDDGNAFKVRLIRQDRMLSERSGPPKTKTSSIGSSVGIEMRGDLVQTVCY